MLVLVKWGLQKVVTLGIVILLTIRGNSCGAYWSWLIWALQKMVTLGIIITLLAIRGISCGVCWSWLSALRGALVTEQLTSCPWLAQEGGQFDIQIWKSHLRLSAWTMLYLHRIA